MHDIVYIVASAPEESASIAGALAGGSFDVRTVNSAEELIATVDSSACGCVVAPVDLPGIGVRGLIGEIRRRQFCLAVVAVGREDDLRAAVDVVRAGAAEFVEPPVNARRLLASVRRAIASARVARAHCR